MAGKGLIKGCSATGWIYNQKIIGSKIIPVGLRESVSM
jgi:hypothetical protein